ncbi:MAG: trigger factor [Parachlamydia sp.]|nr:MAG: trigger factor [Parachlamydia sp.]
MVSTNQSEVSNQHVKISLQKEDGCLVKLDVHMFPETTKATYQEAIKAVAKEVSLPGFRKGKVPPAMILQNFKAHVEREWRDIMLNRGLREFIDLTKIVPFNKESVHKAVVQNAAVEEGADLLIQFESAPEIPKVDPAALRIHQVKKREILPEEIERSMTKVQTHYAEWIPVTDRALQAGDSVVVDAASADNPDNLFYKDTSFTVDDENMMPWFKQAIVGHHQGETVEAEAADQDPPIRVRITLKEIKSPKLPELNDEFAKKAGAENLEDMRQKIRQQLDKHAEEEVQYALRNQIGPALLEKYSFNIPGSIAKQEIKRMISQKTNELKEQGLSGSAANQKIESMREELEKECDESLQLLFLENELVHQFNIQVTDDEVVRELFSQIYKHPEAMQSARDILNSPEMHSRVRHMLTTQKVKDYLVEKAEKIDAS